MKPCLRLHGRVIVRELTLDDGREFYIWFERRAEISAFISGRDLLI